MAVIKFHPVVSDLKRTIDYIANPEKTAADLYTEEQVAALRDALGIPAEEEPEHIFHVRGINCNATCAFDQFLTVKLQYMKTDGTQGIHGFISFKEGEVTPEMAQRIGEEIVRTIWGGRFQAVVTTHLNTTHPQVLFLKGREGRMNHGKEKRMYHRII